MRAPEPAAPSIDRELHAGFLASAERFPDRPALEVEGRTYSYSELLERAAELAATLQSRDPDGGPRLTAVFAYRSATMFTAVLGALLRGHGYVPLNRNLPVERTRLMIEAAGCRALVADAESAAQLEQVLAGSASMVVLVPDADDVGGLAARLPGHTVLGAPDLLPASEWTPAPADPSALAYLLFLSGRRGRPRGLMVAQRSVNHYVDALAARLGISEEDRFSQTSELTFDNSVFDIFVAWQHGACVCCPSRMTLVKPGRYIRDSRLTVWFSVPSTAVLMQRFGMLKPGAYPALRRSLFSCETLPAELADAWLEAAPASTVDSFYGASEVTVDFLGYRWERGRTAAGRRPTIVPMGYPLAGMEVLVAGEDLREVPPGADGELLVSGPQVSLGYLGDPQATAAAFVVPPGRDAVHFRTGARVQRPSSPDAPLVHLGRLDDTVQVLGEPVPLGELEAVLREESGVDAVAALGWPVAPTGAQGVEAFVGDTSVDVEALRARLRERLHGHMVPRRLHLLDALPLDADGVPDRVALGRRLEASALRRDEGR